MEKNIICTVCPRGCHVRVALSGSEVTDVQGYGCKRGKEYAAAEATHPVRILTTTVKIQGSAYDLLPVRSNAPVPKELLMDCMAAIRDGLKVKGIEIGKTIFVRYCRVGAGDAIGDITGCDLVCVLVGERPGLVTDKSMSAYITYRPHTGVSESSRTVVSNIHAQGTPAVEAGAHVAELIDTILKRKVSGVGLHLEAGV